jgi:hypothetical protein
MSAASPTVQSKRNSTHSQSSEASLPQSSPRSKWFSCSCPVDLSSHLPLLKTVGKITAIILFIGGFFCFLPFPILGSAGIIAFTTPLFAIPPVGFAVMIISLVALFSLLSKKMVPGGNKNNSNSNNASKRSSIASNLSIS